MVEVMARAEFATLGNQNVVLDDLPDVKAMWLRGSSAALDALTAAGYAIVPREPTEGMRFAGGGEIGEWAVNQGTSPQWNAPASIEVRWANNRAIQIYRAMLTAWEKEMGE